MMWCRGLLVALCATALACGDDDGTVGDDGGPLPGADAGMVAMDAGPPVMPQPPGSACSCDAECEGDDAHPGMCVYGICMQRAEGACAEGGSTAECNAGARCWGLSTVSAEIVERVGDLLAGTATGFTATGTGRVREPEGTDAVRSPPRPRTIDTRRVYVVAPTTRSTSRPWTTITKQGTW